MLKNIIITISTILLFALNSFADNNTPNTLKKDTTISKDSSTTQQIIDEFYAYAGTIKPEIREEIQKYRVEIVNINKKKRNLYDSLSKEAQNFLTEEQKYKKKLSLSNLTNEKNTEKDGQEHITDKNNVDKDKK